jgi:hypothetical protein
VARFGALIVTLPSIDESRGKRYCPLLPVRISILIVFLFVYVELSGPYLFIDGFRYAERSLLEPKFNLLGNDSICNIHYI